MNTREIRGFRPPSLLLGALAALLLTGACAELRDVVSGDEATPEPEASAAPTATTESDAALEATAPAEAEPETRYIGNTGGLGVSLRSDCATDARIAGGWAEATEVLLLDSDDTRCEGWHQAEAQGVTSWVSELYLVQQRPTVAPSGASAPAPPAASGSTTGAAPTPPPSSTSPPSSGAAPMIVYGPASAGAAVLVLVDGRPCKTIAAVSEPASATGHLWSTQISAGECNAHIGSAITFALNGAPTNERLEWAAGGVPPNVATGVSLTLR
jgi:hypothetical protein